jgi:hypothetical protein
MAASDSPSGKATSSKPDQAAVDPNDPREKFRLALEAKKAKSGPSGQSSSSGAASSKDHSSRSGGKREFRRKSGG